MFATSEVLVDRPLARPGIARTASTTSRPPEQHRAITNCNWQPVLDSYTWYADADRVSSIGSVGAGA
ncbi:hypothetical protein [Kribbella sp. NPDC000426]|uniref:hypothetical protein n=1 Tax=Kribbella sp. NPDC000426 TaxID=3154255 RepID=UPI00331FC50D